MKMTFQEIRKNCYWPLHTNQLEDVNTICRRSWYIAEQIHEARAFNFTYRYIDDVLSINNSRFAEFLPLIYPQTNMLSMRNSSILITCSSE
jgi:hypothetical protein